MTAAVATKYVTPHCSEELGAHENAKVLSPGGTLRPSCRGEYTYRFVTVVCNCWCHEMFRMMRAQQAIAASEGDTGTSDVDTPATVALGPLEPAAGTAPGDPVTAPSEAKATFYEEVVDDLLLTDQVWRFVNKHIFGNDKPRKEDLPQGERRTRGSLDINVETVCRLWLDRKLPYQVLTPSDISMMIDVSDPPSSGAIYAVLQRWKEHGFVELCDKPFRFVKFTSAVDERGISFMKGAMAREKNARAKGFF